MYYRLNIKSSENMIVIGTLKKLYGGLLFNLGIMWWLIIIYVWLAYFNARLFFIDGLVWLGVAGYICVNAGKLLYAGYQMLMDRSLSDEEISEIESLINGYQQDIYRRWWLRTRTSWTTKYIEFDVYFDDTKQSFTDIYQTCLFLKKHLEDDIENSLVTIVPRPEKK